MLSRQRLQQPLLIDPYYRPPADEDDAHSFPSSRSSSPPTDMSSNSRTPSSGGSEYRICFVLCLYDFKSTDPDHLNFRKNEILEIVKQEDSGWWAALRGDRIGWVPSAFLQTISDDSAESLHNVREELRVFEYDNGRLYNSAPVSHTSSFFSTTSPPLDSPRGHDDDWLPILEPEDKTRFLQIVSPTGLVSVDDFPDDVASNISGLSPLSPPQAEPLDDYSTTSESESSPEYASVWSSRPVPPSPTTPMPHPARPKVAPLLINKPTPATPAAIFTSPVTPSGHPSLSRSRSESGPSGLAGIAARSSRRRPIILNDHSSLSSLSMYVDSNDSSDGDTRSLSNPSRSFEDFEEGRSPVVRATRTDKVRQLTGDDDAQAFHNARVAQANSPWYLRPTYGGNEIKLEYDGSVRAGTVQALVERLTVDPLKLSQETRFRRAFLTTFHTFSTADEVFDLLVERYQMDHPTTLNTEEFDEWKEKKLRPVQKRVLTVMSLWLEDYGLLQDDPHVAPRLRDFLALIVAPPSLALTAKHMIQSLDRLATALHSPPPVIITPSRRRRPRILKNDLLRADPNDLAQQLTIYEHRLYVKIRPQECLNWAKTQKGESVANLGAFCATHDKLAAWVKSSVLSNDGLGKRADAIDTWIKIAEKCRALNNFSSMSTIVAALASAVITRLHLTWAHVARSSHLEPLVRLNEPTGNFSAYRNLFQSLDGPCVPFIGMFLTDIVHVQDQLKDTFPPSSSSAGTALPLINFIKRRKWTEAVNAIMRYQGKVYGFGENPSTMSYVEQQLTASAGKDQASFWARSQDLQQSEVAHADIRKGLEAAGF